MRVWDLRTGRVVQTLKVEHIVLSLAFGPDGKTLAAGCDRHGGVRLWKKKDGRFAEERSLPKPATGLALAFSPDERTLAAGDQGSGCIYLYDVRRGTTAGFLWEASNMISKLEFSPDGRSLASAGVNFKIWDIRPSMLPSPDVLDRGRAELERQMKPLIQWHSVSTRSTERVSPSHPMVRFWPRSQGSAGQTPAARP